MGRDDAQHDDAAILIVDDHPMVQHGLRDLLSDEPDLAVVGAVATAREALAFVDRQSVDLLIVDISLQGTDGLELVKQLRAREDDVTILVSSMYDETLYAERCLRAGANGYVGKDAPTEQVVQAVRRVLDGGIYLSPAMSNRLLQRMLPGTAPLETSTEEALSDRELEVFRQLGQGKTTREIAEELHLSVKTIETYRENIKAKLALRNSAELVQRAVLWALEQG